MKKLNDLTLKDCEEALGEKASSWKARCFEIASRIVAAKLVDGTAVYGHWLGPVHAESCFAGGRPFVAALVVELVGFAEEEIRRFVLENPASRIENARVTRQHDPPMLHEWRSVMRGEPPSFDPGERVIDFDKRAMDTETWKFVERYLRIDYMDEDQEPGVLSLSQVVWLANAPLVHLGCHAHGVYGALEKVREAALIPIDNFKRVKEGRLMRIEFIRLAKHPEGIKRVRG